MILNRRHFAAGVLATATSLPSIAQQPDAARIYVGFAPGGLTDLMARRIADKLRGGYAPAVLVENKPGASGQIAISQVKDAPADGSVLLLTHSSAMAMYPFTFKKLPYDPVKDFKPVSLVCHTNHALAVGPLVPASVTNLRQFVAWVKANPEMANTAVPGVGSMPHLVVAVLNKQTGLDLRPVAYKGTATAINDVVAGQVASAAGPVGNYLPQVQAGKLRLIAVSGEARSSFAPTIATFREQGVTMTAREWYGIYLPARASAALQQKAHDQVQAALSDPAVIAFFQQSGVDVAHSTPRMLAQMLDSDTAEWRTLTREIGFSAES